MSTSAIIRALRRHRDELAVRWLDQFAAAGTTAGRPAPEIDEALVDAVFDEMLALLTATTTEHIPRRHHAQAFAALAAFPASVARCIDFFQAGGQTIGAFVVENSEPAARWSSTERNHFLVELDAVCHVLVHREIEALCETCLVPGSGLAIAAASATPFSRPATPAATLASSAALLRN